MAEFTEENIAALEQVLTARQMEVVKAVIEHGSHRKAAGKLGVTHKAVDSVIAAARRRAEKHELPFDLNENPISERPELFHEAWSAADCCNHLRAFWKEQGDKEVSRALYRREGGVSESTWNRYFGTFEEFKRQAGIKLTRGQRRMEHDIARHASRDPMEQFMGEREEYLGKYLKPTDKRWRTVLVGSDFHDIDCDKFLRRVFLDTARRLQPEVVFLNGDMLDLPEFGRYTIDPRTWDVTGRIQWLHTFLADLRTAAPNSEIMYLEGNHEFRLLRHLAEATPALKTVLADLHGFTMPKLLGLDAYEVNYIGKADLKAWKNQDVTRELNKNNYLLWDMLLADHFPSGANEGVPGWNGHHHKAELRTMFSRIFGSYQWAQLGGGHVRSAEYCAGEKWSNGFLIAMADTVTKKSTFDLVDVKEFCMVGGKFYTRAEDELFYDGQTFYPQVL